MTGAGVPVAPTGALAAIGAPAAAEPFGGRMATPGVTKKWGLATLPSWRAAAATGAGFAAAAAGAAFAMGIERRMRRAWLGSMPNAVTATTMAINTGSLFFTSPLTRIGGATFYSMMIIGVLMIEALNGSALMNACDERESFNQAGR